MDFLKLIPISFLFISPISTSNVGLSANNIGQNSIQSAYHPGNGVFDSFIPGNSFDTKYGKKPFEGKEIFAKFEAPVVKNEKLEPASESNQTTTDCVESKPAPIKTVEYFKNQILNLLEDGTIPKDQGETTDEIITFINEASFTFENVITFFPELENMSFEQLLDINKFFIPYFQNNEGSRSSIIHQFQENSKLGLLAAFYEHRHFRSNSRLRMFILQFSDIIYRLTVERGNNNIFLNADVSKAKLSQEFFYRRLSNQIAKNDAISNIRFFKYDLVGLKKCDLFKLREIFSQIYNNPINAERILRNHSKLISQFGDSFRIGLLVKFLQKDEIKSRETIKNTFFSLWIAVNELLTNHKTDKDC